MNIWIVQAESCYEDEGGEILGVFSSEARAVSFANKTKKPIDTGGCSILYEEHWVSIECYKLNEVV